jgi:hypothetical protein
MQLAGTHAGARRAGRVGAPNLSELRRRRPHRRVDPGMPAGAPGLAGARCNARRRCAAPVPGAHVRRSAASPGTRRGPCRPSAPRTCSHWAPGPGVKITSAPSARTVSSNARQNLASRSRSTNWTRRPCSPSTGSRFSACWATQVPLGLGVTPTRWTRRVSSSMKNNTYSRRSQMVSTVEKSQARIRRPAGAETPATS